MGAPVWVPRLLGLAPVSVLTVQIAIFQMNMVFELVRALSGLEQSGKTALFSLFVRNLETVHLLLPEDSLFSRDGG